MLAGIVMRPTQPANNWDTREQVGRTLLKCEMIVRYLGSAESGATFGSWGYTWSYYYSCYGYSSSLTHGCSKNYYGYNCHNHYGDAGVRCYNAGIV